MLAIANNAALILIDVQNGFDDPRWGERNNPDATATFDRTGPDGVYLPAETIYQVELASLHGEFATVVNAADMLAALGR